MAGDLFAGVNEPSDPRNLSDLEKTHVPVIRAPEAASAGESFDVEVEVGALLPHPAAAGHFIRSVELYADDRFLGRVDFAAGQTHPRFLLPVALRPPVRELRAYADCNLHGVWLGRKPIAVRGE